MENNKVPTTDRQDSGKKKVEMSNDEEYALNITE